MISRRDWQLQQLGIIQLTIKHPAVFQNKIVTSISTHIRLVIITNEPISLYDTFINDVLHALELNYNQILQLTPKQAAMLPKGSRCNNWQIGVIAKVEFEGNSIISPTLSELKNDPDAKSKLWRQICNYEYDFFSNNY